jgi:hypothetical protein
LTDNRRKTLREISMELIDRMNLTPEHKKELGVFRMSDAVVDPMDVMPIQWRILEAKQQAKFSTFGTVS